MKPEAAEAACGAVTRLADVRLLLVCVCGDVWRRQNLEAEGEEEGVAEDEELRGRVAHGR